MAEFGLPTPQALENLRMRGLITEEEYARKKQTVVLSAPAMGFPAPSPAPPISSPATTNFFEIFGFKGVPDEDSFDSSSPPKGEMEISDPGWKRALSAEMQKPYYQALKSFLEEERRKKKEIFPPAHLVFAALDLTPLNSVKVVILGQDPYHDVGQAHGLCFSVQRTCAVPPSLKNMYKELQTDIPGFKIPNHGCLTEWAKQGVLLLNATLTVEAHKPNSHSTKGWQTFTDVVIRTVNEQCSGVVFLLLGNFAKKKGALVDEKKHKIINAAHPSPLSQKAFFGCKVFSQTNRYLEQKFSTPIDWSLS